MAYDSIHDDIRAINTSLQALAAGNAANQATLASMNNRLFDDGGSIPTLWDNLSKAKAIAVEANRKVDRQRAYVAGFSGAGLLFGGAIRGLLVKMGWHF